MGGNHIFQKLDPFCKSGNLHVVIETPKGNRNKFKYDPKKGLFKLKKVLPAGMAFPYDFGFIPSTAGEDGDPLDVLLLMDEPAFVGCLVEARLVGVIEATQTEKGQKPIRNDRLIAVAATSHDHSQVKTLKDVNTHLLDEIEEFFVSYNMEEGKKFKPEKRSGPRRAEQLIQEGIKRTEPEKAKAK